MLCLRFESNWQRKGLRRSKPSTFTHQFNLLVGKMLVGIYFFFQFLAMIHKTCGSTSTSKRSPDDNGPNADNRSQALISIYVLWDVWGVNIDKMHTLPQPDIWQTFKCCTRWMNVLGMKTYIYCSCSTARSMMSPPQFRIQFGIEKADDDFKRTEKKHASKSQKPLVAHFMRAKMKAPTNR